MKGIERVELAMSHQQADRVPLFYRDVPAVEARLLNDLGLADREALLQYFEIDFRWVEPSYKPGLVLSNGHQRDIWGVEYRFAKFSENDGYWCPISRPLIDVKEIEALDEWAWPTLDQFDFSNLRADCEKYKDYAIMTAPGYASPGILQPVIQPLIGDERSLIDLIIDPKFIEAMIDKAGSFLAEFVDTMLEASDEKINFFRMGDDFGTQQNLLMGPNTWRQAFMSTYQEIFRIAKSHNAYCYQHSCGAVRGMIPTFLEAGIDVLDPIQVAANGMVPKELKDEFGDVLCFSGGVDEQELLPNGSVQDVKDAVFRLCDDMAENGGFFLGPTHNFQVDIPTANIVAMYEAGREWTY
jgi:uroporphyrinogen decarboxylase